MITISEAVENREALEEMTGDEVLELAYDLLSYVECLWNALDVRKEEFDRFLRIEVAAK